MKIKTEGNTEIFEPEGLTLRSMTDVEIRPIRWINKDRLPRGKFVQVAGSPGTGKTTAVIDWIASETSGRRFAYSQSTGGRGSVVFISAEDDPEDTLKPRMTAAGVDMDRVYIVDAIPVVDGSKKGSFSLARDLAALETTLNQHPEISMIVFDPLSAYLGAKDSHRDADVREVLGPLCQLAARFGVCVIGISHLNKNEGASAMARFMGSTGIIAAARTGYLTAPYEDALILVPVKNNLAPMGTGLKYEIQLEVLDIYSPAITTSKVEWLGEVDITADEVLAASSTQTRQPKMTEAVEFLEYALKDGSKRVEELEQAAREAGLSWHTVKRAKRELKIRHSKSAFSGGWKWFTPEQYRACKHNKPGPYSTDRTDRNPDIPQAHKFSTDRKNIPLKDKPHKGLHEVCQSPDGIAQIAVNPTSEDSDLAKCAKSAVLGNSEGKALL